MTLPSHFESSAVRFVCRRVVCRRLAVTLAVMTSITLPTTTLATPLDGTETSETSETEPTPASVPLRLDAPAERRTELGPWLHTRGERLRSMEHRLGMRLDRHVKASVEITVQDDLEAMARNLGAIGAAVLQGDRLHVVLDARNRGADDFLVDHELARLMLRRTGVSLPPWIEDGAALWLSGRWYGRDWSEWLPVVAAADVLPSVDELLAGTRQHGGSRVLWPPVAATVIDALPGDTLRQKLEPMPTQHDTRRLVARILASAPSRTSPRARPAENVGATAGASNSRRESFHNGVSFAMANGIESGYHAPAAERQLDLLADLGVDAVSVMPFAYQRDPNRPGLRFLNERPSSETDIGLLHTARRAREHGHRVLWKPHLWIGHDSWPGDIEMVSESAWRAWFRDYRRYVLHHAVLAEHAGAEWFSVGVELGKTVRREADWRHLVASVRSVYAGRLTYAGNWWGDYRLVEFWDALDAIGVDAYFPLAHRDDAHRTELVEGARAAIQELRDAHRRWHLPVLLTEVGFAARKGAWVSPHEEGGQLSEADQSLAWEVLLGELGKPDWLLGVYAWKVFSHPRGEGHGRPDFRFLGRPAQEILTAYFRSRPAELRVDVTSQ